MARKPIKYNSRNLVGPRRRQRLQEFVENTSHLGGACAEVGVYKGSTAEVIAYHKGERPLYLFDTFCGIPNTCEKDNHHIDGDFFNCDKQKVISLLSEYESVHVFEGIFPQENSEVLDGLTFSFVHLDVDVYQSYKDCLEFFFPRMKSRGIMVFDDYAADTCLGAKLAIDEFFADKRKRVRFFPLLNCQLAVTIL